MNNFPESKELAVRVAEAGTGLEKLPTEELRERLLVIKKVKKTVTDRKEEITAPMRKALESARDLFRPLEKIIDDTDKAIRGALLVAEEKREKEQAKLAGKVAEGEVSMDQAVDLMTTKPSGLYRVIKELAIIDKKKIPKKYWVIDEVAVRAALMEGTKVPGAILKDKRVVQAK